MEPHLNLVCERCGSKKDINDGCLKDLIEKVAKQAKFSLSGQRFVLYGLCDQCKSAKKESHDLEQKLRACVV
jgi:Fe2+ or Zn2+ uptake regulation protein